MYRMINVACRLLVKHGATATHVHVICSWEKKKCGNETIGKWKLCMSVCITLEGVLYGRVCDIGSQ